MALLVNCSEKAKNEPPFEQLKALGGKCPDGACWKRSIETVIAEIEAGEQSYYVNINGLMPNLIVATRLGKKFLRTYFDLATPESLLALPDC